MRKEQNKRLDEFTVQLLLRASIPQVPRFDRLKYEEVLSVQKSHFGQSILHAQLSICESGIKIKCWTPEIFAMKASFTGSLGGSWWAY